MSNLFKTIKDACDDLNSMGIHLSELRVPESKRDELQEEFLRDAHALDEIDIVEGKTTVKKISYNKNTIKILWYEDNK